MHLNEELEGLIPAGDIERMSISFIEFFISFILQINLNLKNEKHKCTVIFKKNIFIYIYTSVLWIENVMQNKLYFD